MIDFCQSTRAALSAYVDGELPPDDAAAIADHLTTCAHCSADYHTVLDTIALTRSQLDRFTAPDVLRARIRAAIATTPAEHDPALANGGPRSGAQRSRWWPQRAVVAAGLVLAAALGSGTTLLVRERAEPPSVATQVLSSHLRSLMPNHLTDVASNDQHNVKPWFNGRLDYSPTVPRFDDQGFPLLGGRIDYVGGRPVAVVVYGRRQHLINVFSWPASGSDEALTGTVANGYTMYRWRSGGIEHWVVSDVNAAELKTFAEMVQRASS
jgi:anti-sigma factor RsiW